MTAGGDGGVGISMDDQAIYSRSNMKQTVRGLPFRLSNDGCFAWVAQTTNVSIDRSTPRGRGQGAAHRDGKRAMKRRCANLLFAGGCRSTEPERSPRWRGCSVVALVRRRQFRGLATVKDPIAGEKHSRPPISPASIRRRLTGIRRPTANHRSSRPRPSAGRLTRRDRDGTWRVDLLNFSGATREQLPQQTGDVS